MVNRRIPIVGGVLLLAISGWLGGRAEEVEGRDQAAPAECSYFGPDRARLLASSHETRSRGRITEAVAARLASSSQGSRAKSFAAADSLGTIDRHLFQAMTEAGVEPAASATDWEYIRRVTLDLTGRIPTAQRVLAFVNDSSPDKKAKLADELLQRTEWVDKWTMYFGDLYKNTVATEFIRRWEPGRNAFYAWIRDSLKSNKPYNRMATELIAARGENSWTQGELNWLLGGWVIANPIQDNWDQQAANASSVFLGISHLNCVLCHNGRGHLDALSLWGKTATRSQAWGMAAFFSHSSQRRVRVEGTNPVYSWRVDENLRTDYPLNTTTGNRPARTGSQRTVSPEYLFTGQTPPAGDDYREAFARLLTGDLQFARATVNYQWKEFFGIGLVDPPDQFDPARLDPDNPPSEPWTLQPSNPRLLNALAQEFAESGFDLKALQRKIVLSEAYQLSSRYPGEWNPAWDRLFARKLVRRLWAEEVHDAIAQSSNLIPSYTLPGFSAFLARDSVFAGYPAFGPVSWAMQFPDTTSGTGAISPFLDSFTRGDRDSDTRSPEGSLLQALNLMNDPFVTSRIRAASGPAESLLRINIGRPDDELIRTLFLTVLSRYPDDGEMTKARAALRAGNRNTAAENLLWSLYNKVDFIFNY